ncbi:MAG: PqqD family peptide modification chaperone [Methanosarcina sp.]
MGLKSIKWDITGNCNLRCIHCCTGDKYAQEKEKELSLEKRFKILDILAAGGVSSVNLLGGEPLTLGDDFFSIIEYGVSKGIHMSSNTNGLLLKSDVIKRLVEVGISSLTVSIEGSSSEAHDAVRGKGTFKKIIANVRNLTEYISKEETPMDVFVNTVLNKQNYSNIEEMVDLCLNLKVNKWSLLQLGFVGYAKDNVNNLALTTEEIIDTARRVAKRVDPDFNDLKGLVFENRFTYSPVSSFITQQHGYKLPKPEVCCTGSLCFGFVDPYGNMFACERIPGNYIGYNINSAPITTMNLLDNDFYQIWNSGYFMEMFPLILDSSTYKNYEPCNHCKLLRIGECTPCPLNSLKNEKVVIDDCLYIEQKLGDINNFEEEIREENLQHSEELKIKENIQEHNDIKAFDLTTFEFEQYYPVRTDGIRSYEEKGRYTLFNPYTLETIELNKIGTYVWDLIDGNTSIYRIIKSLTDETDLLPVSEELFREKANYFFYSLNKKQLIMLNDTKTTLKSPPVNAS